METFNVLSRLSNPPDRRLHFRLDGFNAQVPPETYLNLITKSGQDAMRTFWRVIRVRTACARLQAALEPSTWNPWRLLGLARCLGKHNGKEIFEGLMLLAPWHRDLPRGSPTLRRDGNPPGCAECSAPSAYPPLFYNQWGLIRAIGWQVTLDKLCAVRQFEGNVRNQLNLNA